MTDKEAYELMYKYGGGEKGIIMIKEMIHLVGVEGAKKNIIKAAKANNTNLPDDVKDWIYQGLRYIQSQMDKPLN